MSNNFYAFISRMKYINRWGLMRNTISENIQEHSFSAAVIAHALAIINNRYLNGNINPERTALLAMFHDAEETITGDMPTPVKYFSPDIRNAYGSVETVAKNKLLSMLPEAIREDYIDLFYPPVTDLYMQKLVKAADTLSAYIKCIEELKAGNKEFSAAKEATGRKIKELNCPEADIFMEKFVPGFEKSLDELD